MFLFYTVISRLFSDDGNCKIFGYVSLDRRVTVEENTKSNEPNVAERVEGISTVTRKQNSNTRGRNSNAGGRDTNIRTSITTNEYTQKTTTEQNIHENDRNPWELVTKRKKQVHQPNKHKYTMYSKYQRGSSSSKRSK
jgi:hypothetical protein